MSTDQLELFDLDEYTEPDDYDYPPPGDKFDFSLDSDPLYRRDMQDAGRGYLLRD